ncbi:hypothetical protein FNF29_05106 [Cafeteria roenbergensis]|uniref:Uncharacterized protein n=1 Tax=Cafeteria roenbergensis TaxID=33653 RepID=A0A5A8CFW8_CAFRO|nr:hypothetical protein FNF29_05106 [Cafeteria roenbergensis]KAA0152244.1 hypothetical protein FNF31_06675 [Cafeteria roenbergensis]KAA0154633.1 hypothetical protein FNF28_06809 [Cafeteria roenbergensis]|eukprot:KAA0150771.1 hypothetical protein FNF29_05106 [Cafeteria roenbergensis]
MDTEQRLAAVEEALGLPSEAAATSATPAEVTELRARVEALQAAIEKRDFRIGHLMRSLADREARLDAAGLDWVTGVIEAKTPAPGSA